VYESIVPLGLTYPQKGECNYLLQLRADYRLHPLREYGPGGWLTSTRYLSNSPANWEESQITALLDLSEQIARQTVEELNLRGTVIRKKRAVGLVPVNGQILTRESLDELVLRIHERVQGMNDGKGPSLPYCAFNGGSDAWIDVGNKRVGVEILQSYCGIPAVETLHIGDQFLNTGNDFAARTVSPCIWIINPQETTYILKSILQLAGVNASLTEGTSKDEDDSEQYSNNDFNSTGSMNVNFDEMERRTQAVARMDVYTGNMIN
jgi:IMP and pyridine-specific 5'-nucleotidase